MIPSVMTMLLFWPICYGFVLISTAVSDGYLFEPGKHLKYNLHSTVLLDGRMGSKKPVGFYVAAELNLDTIWSNDDIKILKLELISPNLHVKTRKAPSPDGFNHHTSKLQKYPSEPFYLVWTKGIIDTILLPRPEPLANLKKGLASLLQFQVHDGTRNETDAVGTCLATYKAATSSFTKTSHCPGDLPLIRNNHPILDTHIWSTRTTDYDVVDGILKTIHQKEYHETYLSAKNDIGARIEVEQILTLAESGKCDQVQGTLEEVLNSLAPKYRQESLVIEKRASKETGSFYSSVKELRYNLENLGNSVSAKTFIKLVTIARRAKKEDLLKTLETKKNQKIMLQLCDILGFVQTEDSHKAVMKKIHLDIEDHTDYIERYFWALSISAQPNPEIVVDLLRRYQKSINIPKKVKETLVLTLASMAKHLGNQSKIKHKVEEMVLNGLDYAKDEERHVFLRALKNLQLPSTIPILLDAIRNGTAKDGVLAFKVLQSFPKEYWDDNIRNIARKALWQIDRKYDTSSRTLAIDILLETRSYLDDLVVFLKANETSYEVKQYLYQKLQMIMDEDIEFAQTIWSMIKKDPTLYNYSILAPKGLSTALKRSFATNGSLLTVQEMHNGIVKRGIVNINLEKNGLNHEIINLGIFSGGLSSYISKTKGYDDETVTAGMELTILDNQIRPFVFFNGQGELMGHIWSASASESTTAFQALILLQDHHQYLRLGSGYIVEVDVKGGLSFDLSGEIKISVWNRNAVSKVAKTAGISVVGSIKLDTDFVYSQVEFVASVEAKLILQSDIDFARNRNLCMRLIQPSAIVRQNTYGIERIPGSKHNIRIVRSKKYEIPGKTYALNRRNNEMCNKMF